MSKEIKDFEDFIQHFKSEALKIDLEKTEPRAYDILQTQKTKLSFIQFDSQRDEVVEFSKQALTSTADLLIQAFNSKSYLHRYTNNNPRFLNHLKAYFEYKDLYEKATSNELKYNPNKEKLKPTNNIIYKAGQLNTFTANLFTYILDEYPTKGKVKFINIWYFLRKDIKSRESIIFNFTQDEYEEFVKTNYQIQITTWKKTNKYKDIEIGNLQNIVTTFRQNLK